MGPGGQKNKNPRSQARIGARRRLYWRARVASTAAGEKVGVVSGLRILESLDLLAVEQDQRLLLRKVRAGARNQAGQHQS